MHTNNFHNKDLVTFAKANRKKQTPAEMLLWSKLRNKQFHNLKFYRQRSIDKYIVDFLQPDNKLIIEIDGSSHDDNKYTYDILRENKLRDLEYKVLRFSEYEVNHRVDDVLQSIYNLIHPLLGEGWVRDN